MNFAAMIGDDEHTAADGAYVRLLKTRKWVYLTAALALILAFDLMNFERFNDAVKYVELPEWLARQAVLASLVYISIQYGLLFVQTTSTYRTILDERLEDKRQARYDELIKEYERAQSDFAEFDAISRHQNNTQAQQIAHGKKEVMEKVISRLSATLDRLSSAPKLSPLFVSTEVAVDFVRTIPPFFLAAHAFLQLIDI